MSNATMEADTAVVTDEATTEVTAGALSDVRDRDESNTQNNADNAAANPQAAVTSRYDDTIVGLEESMMVRLASLDTMLELAGEVIIVSSNLNTLSRTIQQGTKVTGELSEEVKDLAITTGRISGDLHHLVTDVRTVNMADLFGRFRRLARDTSRRLGKPVRLEVQGEDVCIDKKISETIYDPIAHQIRNAIAHGIEDEQTRTRLGKDPVGTVQVIVKNFETSTIIEVTDDGRGIDADMIRRRIVQRGWVTADQAAQFSDDDVFEYLYLPGFSTADETSVTSGRGVGMDVIRTVMSQIGGETRIATEVGVGTTFSFILPSVTAVNISDALLVRANETYYAFPILSVLSSQSISVDQIHTTMGRGRSVTYLGSILPVFDLQDVFGEPPVEPTGDEVRLLIVEWKQHRVAYVVSDFLNPQKIVISDVNGMDVSGISGTAVLSGRQLCMVVDMPGLVSRTFGDDKDMPTSRGSYGGHIDRIRAKIAAEVQQQAEQSNAAGSVASENRRSLGGKDDGLALTHQADRAFLREVESTLSHLNRELLSLEEDRRTEKADAVFRLVHSVKGNLTMSGADRCAAVAHRIETILERARRDDSTLTDDAFDILFDGTGYIESFIKAALNNEPTPDMPQNLADAVDADTIAPAAASDQMSPQQSDPQIRLDATGEFYLSSRRRDGASLYQAAIRFDAGDQPEFLIAYLILRRIQRIADVLGTSPGVNELEAGVCDGRITVLFSPRDNQDDLVDKLAANLKRYYGVTSFDAAPYA